MESAVNIWSMLDNREKALIIWVSVLLVWGIFYKSVRSSVLALLKIFFSKKIFVPLFLMFAYIASVVFLAYKLQIWQMLFLKDTIILAFGIGFIMFFNINKASSDNDYLKKTILKTLKITIIFEFIINLYVFNLLVELILIPILTFLTAMLALSETKKEYTPVKKLLNVVLSIVGLYFITYAFSNIVSDFNKFATTQNLGRFLLSPLLTLVYAPFIYCMALFSAYETLFVRVEFLVKGSKKLKKAVKWWIFKHNLFNLAKLNNFSRTSANYLMSIRKTSDIFRYNSTRIQS